MDPLELTRPRFFLSRGVGKEKIFHTSHCEQLRIVKIANHPMMREIFKEKGQPSGGISTHPEVDNSLMNFSIDLNLISLWLGGDRLPGSASAVFCNFILSRAHLNDVVRSPFPLFLVNSAINLGRLAITSDEIGVELKVRQSFIL